MIVPTFEMKVLYNRAPMIRERVSLQKGRVSEETANFIQQDAKSRCPVGTRIRPDHRPGHLRDSIRVTPRGSGYFMVAVYAEYGGYVEYGTYRAAAQPFFNPAIEAASPRYVRGLQRLFEAA